MPLELHSSSNINPFTAAAKLERSVSNDSCTTTNQGLCGKRMVSMDGMDSPLCLAHSDFVNLFSCDRTGRWTSEEVEYVNALIEAFDSGLLMIVDGTKLHDFLTKMLKCKLSRLTKKFKRANFTRCYAFSGKVDDNRAIQFEAIRKKLAQTFEPFVSSQPIFAMQAELKLVSSSQWRKYLVEFCLKQLGTSLDNFIGAEEYLRSIDELDRRIEYHAKERKKRRKLDVTSGKTRSCDNISRLASSPTLATVGSATEIKLGSEDMEPVPAEPIIVSSNSVVSFVDEELFVADGNDAESKAETIDDEFLFLWGLRDGEEDVVVTDDEFQSLGEISDCQGGSMSPVHPFLAKLEEFVTSNALPFEYMDFWMPSFDEEEVRLIFGGSVVPACCEGDPQLVNFAEFSSKFDFEPDVCLPGRVYASGRPCWEQAVQFAAPSHFLRVEGAALAGIQTAVGIPVSCEAVGTLVVCFFSRVNLDRDDALVSRLWKDLNGLNSISQWALDIDDVHNFDVLDAAGPVEYPSAEVEQQRNQAGISAADAGAKPVEKETSISAPLLMNNCETVSTGSAKKDLLNLLTKHIPVTTSTSSQEEVMILNGFMLLRMLLLRSESVLSAQDLEATQVICVSYELYAKMNKWSRKDLSHVIVREFMFLNPSGTGMSLFSAPANEIWRGKNSSPCLNAPMPFALPSMNLPPASFSHSFPVPTKIQTSSLET